MKQIKKLSMILMLFMLGASWSGNLAAANNKQTPSSTQQLAESLLTDITQATWITEGKSPHVVYVFFDANCPYCHQLYLNTRPWIKQGKLELRWIPVGTLTTTSKGKAAAMLQAKNPLAAFHKNQEQYDQGGGIEEDLPSTEVEKQLSTNAALLARTPFGSVPTLVLRANDGTPVLAVGSPPKDKLKSLLDNVK